MDLALETVLDDPDRRYWDLYRRAFSDLATNAVQEHLITEEEFKEILRDERVGKYVVSDPDRGRICALAVMTKDLDAVHLVSTAYFRRHFPVYEEAGRVWYVQFVAVDPDYQGSGVFPVLVDELCRNAREAGGMVCVDVCEYRESGMGLPDVLERFGHLYDPMPLRHRLDAQVYWAYEFPKPA